MDLSPPTTLSGFSGPEDTVRAMIAAVNGPRGERSMMVRTVTEQVVHQLQPKDYLSELIAIRNWVATHVRYANDSLTTEVVKDPQRLIEEIMARGMAVGDCDDSAVLIACMCQQLGREAEFVTAGFGPSFKICSGGSCRYGANYSHVFPRAKEPKSGQWIVLDTVAGSNEAKMLRRVTSWRAWRIDQ